jgi:LAS superfamily LD-carboxypeptidase LdcB
MAGTSSLTALELTGRARTHVVDLEDPRCAVHRDVVAPLRAMRAAAAREGLDLIPVSGFRDFDRQLAIWNGKCLGERELLDPEGRPLSAATLRETELVASILHWSALPGASRHHWGTEIDVIDAAAWPEGVPVSLVPEAYAAGGPFAALNVWLDHNAVAFGFYRPYATQRGGVQPEPWHLSYAPVSVPALGQFTLDMLQEAVASAGMELASVVGAALPSIWERYVVNVDAPPAALAQAVFNARETRPS